MLLLVKALTEIFNSQIVAEMACIRRELWIHSRNAFSPLPQESGQRHSSPSHGHTTAQIQLARQVSLPKPAHSQMALKPSTAFCWQKQSKPGGWGRQRAGINHSRLIMQGVFDMSERCETSRGDRGRKKKKEQTRLQEAWQNTYSVPTAEKVTGTITQEQEHSQHLRTHMFFPASNPQPLPPHALPHSPAPT